MMIRALTVAACLAAAGSASAQTVLNTNADFLGFDMRIDAAATANAQALAGALADAVVYRMYAVFANTPYVVVSVSDASFNLTGPGTLYQDAFGAAAGAPNGAFIPLAPTLAFDSFITLNLLTDAGNTVGPDADFAWAANGVAAGGWANSNPPNLQGTAVLNGGTGNFETLLGQFTVVGSGLRDLAGPTFNADQQWFGQATLAFNTGVGTQGYQLFMQGFIPTPGSVALFGLAGLAAARRRR